MQSKLNQDELLEQINSAIDSTTTGGVIVSNSIKSICKRIKHFNNSEETQD